MARISAKQTLEALKSKNPPKLVIVGSAKATEGRTHTLMKIRPSTLRRLQAVALGPVYLLLEHAMLRLVEELEQVPDGMTRTIDAATFNASDEDIAEVAAAQSRIKPGRSMNRMRKQGAAVWPADADESSPAPAPEPVEPKKRVERANPASRAKDVADAALATAKTASTKKTTHES